MPANDPDLRNKSLRIAARWEIGRRLVRRSAMLTTPSMPDLRDDATEAPANPGAPELTVVIPTLNERDNISLLVQRLESALAGIRWEAVFVNDNSVDGTMEAVRDFALRDARVRGIRRIARRGLAGACLEGMLSSSSPVVAVIDGDLQHDETRLPEMLGILRRDEADLVVASRYTGGGEAVEGFNRSRQRASQLATRLAGLVVKRRLSDPMSGFFMIRRSAVDAIAPRLSRQGFKILLDIVASSPATLRIAEIPYVFGRRIHGTSKLDAAVAFEYFGLLLAKASGDRLSLRFFSFAMVGSLGIGVNLAALAGFLDVGWAFTPAQTAAMLTAMTSNYFLNNAITYRDRRRGGWKLWAGLLSFAALCSVGLVAGVGVSGIFYYDHGQWWLAGLAGAAVGSAWNYVTNSAFTWGIR